MTRPWGEIAESPQCTICAWMNPYEHVCPAYPSGIPDRILNNEVMHTEVLEDQIGYTTFTIIE